MTNDVSGIAVRRALFIDRDGPITKLIHDGSSSGRSPYTTDELDFEDTLDDALNLATQSNFLLVVITNQPGISLGLLELQQLKEIHARMLNDYPFIETVYTCIHSNVERCLCRKPLPGLLLRASKEMNICLEESWMIGDRWIDIAAGSQAGCRTVLIERPYSWVPNSAGSPPHDLRPTLFAETTLEAVRGIIKVIKTYGV